MQILDDIIDKLVSEKCHDDVILRFKAAIKFCYFFQKKIKITRRKVELTSVTVDSQHHISVTVINSSADFRQFITLLSTSLVAFTVFYLLHFCLVSRSHSSIKTW